MKALVLAAGFGTRLAPYTQVLPKALFPVNGIPVLGRMITDLKRAGCTAVAVNAHHLAEPIQAYLADNDFGIPVQIRIEREILGTGGAIRRLEGFWGKDPFIVVNADIITDINLAEAYRSHLEHNAPATLVMHDHPDFNQVWVDSQGRVMGFARIAGRRPGQPCRRLAFTGIHILDPETIRHIPATGFSDIVVVYQGMLCKGLVIRAHVVDGHYWQDMGNPERYREAVIKALAPDAFQTAFGRHPIDPVESRRMEGDGSDRRWWRLKSGNHRLVMADHGISLPLPGSEVNAFIHIGNHLAASGLPVPRIHAHEATCGLVIMDDLGDRHLQQLALRHHSETRIETAYRAVIDTMIELTTQAAMGFDPAWTCQSRAYDRELILEKECRYFVDAFLNGYLDMDVNYHDLSPEFENLAQSVIDCGAHGLIHRDMQSRNIMLCKGRHYFIDFQGARPGPVQYDLASLLIDPYARLDQKLQHRLLDYAVGQAVRHLSVCADTFIRGYHFAAVARNLQMLGAFGFLTRKKHKSEFERWIPVAVAMLPDHLRAVGGPAGLVNVAQKINLG